MGANGTYKVNGIPILAPDYTTGNVFFVGSGHSGATDSGGWGGHPHQPFATIDYAIGQCTANNGDIIYVMPGHDENPTTSITADVAGISIIGLGNGSDRPTITFGALAATLAISAASVTVKTLRFDLGAVADTITNAINITGDSAHVEGCETVVHATSQFTNHLTTTDAQFVKIIGNKFHSLHTESSTSGVVLDGCDDIEVIGNQIMGHFTEHALDNTTPGSVDEVLRARIVGNFIMNNSVTGGDMAVDMDDSATGWFTDNRISGGLATVAANIDVGNMASIENYVVDDFGVDVHGIVFPATAAT